MNAQQLTQLGGLFSILVFWHFVADGTFQTHKEALTKSTNRRVRLRHCASYTLLFCPSSSWSGFTVGQPPELRLCSF